ncbi:hypothetical protein Tco_1555130 [Tanacetum coccineum]
MSNILQYLCLNCSIKLVTLLRDPSKASVVAISIMASYNLIPVVKLLPRGLSRSWWVMWGRREMEKEGKVESWISNEGGDDNCSISSDSRLPYSPNGAPCAAACQQCVPPWMPTSVARYGQSPCPTRRCLGKGDHDLGCGLGVGADLISLKMPLSIPSRGRNKGQQQVLQKSRR